MVRTIGGNRDKKRTASKAFGNVRVEGEGPAARLRIDPDQNIMIGSDAIRRYIGIRSNSTLYRWVELFSFPAIKRPDGMWMSSMTAIDQWIFLAAEAALDRAHQARSMNVNAEKALERLRAKIENGKLNREQVRVALKTGKAVGLVDAEKIDMRRFKGELDVPDGEATTGDAVAAGGQK